MRRRTAAIALVTTAALALGGCGDDGETAGTEPDGSTSTTTEASTTTTSTTAPTSTATTTTVVTTAPAGPPVTVLDAGPAGGSGEIQLTWDGVAGATGYRVERADASAGPFEVAATIDLASGEITRATGVVNVLLATGDQPFTYVEVGGADRRFLRVVAVHGGADAEPSPVVCGAPVGRPDC
jgi:hypothetical protein